MRGGRVLTLLRSSLSCGRWGSGGLGGLRGGGRGGGEGYAVTARGGLRYRSGSPHRSPTRTRPELVCKIVHLRWKKRLGPVGIGARVGMPASTVHAVLVRVR